MKYQVQGTITYLFNGYSDKVAKQVGHQHTGQDEVKGWLQPWFADNDFYCYKTFDDRYPKWQAVHGIIEENGRYYETIYGHFRHLAVEEGKWVKKGQVVGFEGNAGEVYSGGRKVTDKERLNGSTAGSHCHRGFVREVKRVKKTKTNEHYLRTNTGAHYRDDEGYYYEIVNKDNGANGWEDPMKRASTYSIIRMWAYKYRMQGNYVLAHQFRKAAEFVKNL